MEPLVALAEQVLLQSDEWVRARYPDVVLLQEFVARFEPALEPRVQVLLERLSVRMARLQAPASPQ